MILLEIWKGVLAVGLYLGAFVFAGALLPEKYHKSSLTNLCLLGFVVYFGVFQIVALPMKIGRLSLKYLTLTWVGILGVVFLFDIIGRRKILSRAFKNCFSDSKKIAAGCVFLIAAGVLALILGMNVNHISDFDAGYYIGLPVSSVYSNTIELMDPYSGQMLSRPDSFYILNTNTVHSAVIFQALNLHPLVEEKFSMTAALSVVFCLFLYKGGKLLFQENRRKALMFLMLSVLTLLFSYSLAGVSHYFAYRTYEGKAITAYLYTTGIFVFFLGIFREKEKKWGWTGLFFAALGGVAFCNTAIFVIPVMISALVLPWILLERKWKAFLPYMAVMAVSGFWLCLHLIL